MDEDRLTQSVRKEEAVREAVGVLESGGWLGPMAAFGAAGMRRDLPPARGCWWRVLSRC